MANAERLSGIDVIRETESAVLVRYKDREIWFPLSQVERITRRPEQGKSEIYVATFILKSKGLA